MEMLLSLAAFAFATAGTPGPNNIMLTASGVNYGFARSLPHMAGVVVGFAVLLAACAGGLGLFFTAFPVAHTFLKVAGAVYLLWLAFKVATAGHPAEVQNEGGRPLSFLQAAAFQWVNPKGVLTALSAVTLFVRPQSASADIAAMMAVFVFATVVSVVVWTAFGTVVSHALGSARRARIFNVVMALLLTASIVPMVR